MSANEKKHEESELVRKFKANPPVFIGTVIVLVIVIVAFVLVPAIVPNSGGGRSTDLTFGTYDKAPVAYVPGNYFARYYDMVARYRQNMDPNNFQYASYQIWREAFEAAVVHTAMLQEMKRANYTPPVKTVDHDVAMLPQFQENGRFSAALYNRMDNNARLSLWREVQDDITKERYRTDITGLLSPGTEADFIGQMAAAQRSFDMVSFSVDAYPDSEYVAFADEHPDLFRSVHLSMLTINSSEREAAKVLGSIKDGTLTFEDAARAHSQDGYTERGGDMGIRMAYELSQEITDDASREKAIALAKGEYSAVVKNGAGWAIFRAEENIQAADTADAVTLEKVRSYVRNFERGRMEDWAIGNAEEFRAQVAENGFDDAAYRQGLEKKHFGPVPLNYGSVDLFTALSSASVAELSAAAQDENFWKAAFSTQVGSPSSPLVQGGNVLVLLPTEETDAEESSIEGIKSTLSSYWLSYSTERSMQNYFLNSPKMEDKFLDVYFRYFMPTGE